MRPTRILAVTFACATAVAAQNPPAVRPAPPVVFLEKAYFSGATPTGKHVLFEGQPTVHYFIWNGMSKEDWQANEGNRHWALAVPVSATFMARMTKDDTQLQNGERAKSEPVLTPSYRIGIRPQLFYLKHDIGSPKYLLIGATGGLTHYSNGQHGCTYIGFTRDASGTCNPTDPQLASQSIANLIDGDFSTTYFSEALDIRFGHLTGAVGTTTWLASAGVELKQDPLDFKPGGTNHEQAVQYGQNELTVRASFEYQYRGRPSGIARLATTMTRRAGGGVASALNAQDVELSYVFNRLNHLGPFVRRHWGYDYYNIHFQERAPFFNIGVMWDVGRLDHMNGQFKP